MPSIEYVGDSERFITAGGWKRTNDSFSEFAVQMVIFETLNVPGFNANGISDHSVLERIEKNFTKLGFPDWSHPPTLFYGSDDAILIVFAEEKLEICLGALSLPALKNAILMLGDIQWRW